MKTMGMLHTDTLSVMDGIRGFISLERKIADDLTFAVKENVIHNHLRGEHFLIDKLFGRHMGVIRRIHAADRVMDIEFDDRMVEYDFSSLEDLEHAYAITVHKSQGSEYPIVIVPMYAAPPMLLTRNLLYTAVTRAQNMVIFVGRQEVVAQMVGNNRQSMRYTGLAQRLRTEVEK